MRGYFTKKGVVFTTNLRIVAKSGKRLPVDHDVIAEPGDMINVEGTLLYNLTRASIGHPRIVHSIDDAKFVLSKAS